MMPGAWNTFFPCRPNTDKSQNQIQNHTGGNTTLAKKKYLCITFLKDWRFVLLYCNNQIKVSNVEGPHLQVCLSLVPHRPWGRLQGTAAPRRGWPRGRRCQPGIPCLGSFADSDKYLLSSAGSDTLLFQKWMSIYRLFCELKLFISKFWGARWQQRVFWFKKLKRQSKKKDKTN